MSDSHEFPPSSHESLSPLMVEDPENIWQRFICYYLRESCKFCLNQLEMNETHPEFFMYKSYGKKCKSNNMKGSHIVSLS